MIKLSKTIKIYLILGFIFLFLYKKNNSEIYDGKKISSKKYLHSNPLDSIHQLDNILHLHHNQNHHYKSSVIHSE